MRKGTGIQGFGAFLCMLILILDGKTALEGASQGVDLCLKTIVPSLFPFFILSILLTSSFSGHSMPLLRSFGRLLRIPEGMEGILISGFLGGYPAGAQCIAQEYRRGALTRREAQRMLAFCSNAGPSFLFGIVSQQFTNRDAVWALWLIHIISAVLTARLFPSCSHQASPEKGKTVLSFPDALQSAIKITANVCGWVILFRIVLVFLKRWCLWIFPVPWQVAIAGILELSNGCMESMLIQDERLRFLLCSGMLAFGGICVLMQTASVCSGLSVSSYLLGKLSQTVFSIMLSLVFLYRAWYLFLLLVPAILGELRNGQKRSSFQELIGV